MASGTVCYLHGVGGVREDWAAPLVAPLLEIAPLALPRFIAPGYSDLLAETRIEPGSPAVPEPAPAWMAEASSAEARRDYVERQRRIATSLQDVGEALPAGAAWPLLIPRPSELSDRLPWDRVIRTPVLGVDQVGRFLDDPEARDAVAHRIVEHLRQTPGPVTLIGHSLGSLVAVDVLARLPDDVTVSMLITLGSPLGHPAIGTRLRDRPFPYARVGGWVNAVHLLDPITLGRGAAALFPAAHDVFLPVLAGDSGLAGLVRGLRRAATAHLDYAYLASDTVRRAVILGVHGAEAIA